MSKTTIDPKSVSLRELHGLLLGSVVPRPIAFASTIDKEGKVNLSPFSYFNVFSANPPILIFSPARRGRDGTTKHTHENVLEVPECTINMVNFDIVEQMSLASTEYPKGVNEFIKAGLTQAPSEKVKPPCVYESPVSFECKVIEVKPLGKDGGAGNLIICEVVLMHLNEDILEDGKINPFKLDAVARMGGNYYTRVQGESIFEVKKPLSTLGIGIDQLPKGIRESNWLTGAQLAKLGSVDKLPEKDDVLRWAREQDILDMTRDAINRMAKQKLEEDEDDEALKFLLYNRFRP